MLVQLNQRLYRLFEVSRHEKGNWFLLILACKIKCRYVLDVKIYYIFSLNNSFLSKTHTEGFPVTKPELKYPSCYTTLQKYEVIWFWYHIRY